jgi:hypothetical protein
MYRGTQIGESHTTLFVDAELSTFNFALGYSVSWNSRCVWRGYLYDAVLARSMMHEKMHVDLFYFRDPHVCVIFHSAMISPPHLNALLIIAQR